MSFVWVLLIAMSVAAAAVNGKLGALTGAITASAQSAVTLSLGLVGVMTLWLGLMRVAEEAGLVSLLARAARPVLRFLFPEVPAEHPAMGAMVMNVAANMLGLGNAATPLGLRAMRDLERLNPHPGTATNAMCTFLAINTSSVQLIPTTAIAILVAAGSKNPTAIVGTALLATLCAATVAISSVKLLEKLSWFRIRGERLVAGTGDPGSAESKGDDSNVHPANPAPSNAAGITDPGDNGRLRPWGKALLAIFALFFLALFVRQIFPEALGLSPGTTAPAASYFVRGVSALSLLAIPLLLSFFVLYAALRGLKVYDEFVEGAKEGFGVILKIIPFLVTMLMAIGMFKGAGGIELLARALAPVLAPLHFPTDLLPIALMRPLSGGATLALFTDVVHRLGPDNIVSLMAATIYGSTETTFYVAAVYFGSVGIKQTRHAIPAGLLADFAGVVASVIICRAVLGT